MPICLGIFEKASPLGLGIDEKFRSLEGFFLVHSGMQEREKLAMGIAVYAIGRATAQARTCPEPPAADVLLRLHAREGMRGSAARKELMAAERTAV